MADSYNKKEREKKRQKRKKEKEQRKEQRKTEGKTTPEFMYQDEYGNLTATPPDPDKRQKIKAEDIALGIPKQEKNGQPHFVRSGTVKFFNTEKGYGFIIDDETQESFFAHVNDLEDVIKDNDKVQFEVGKGPKGPVALAVKLV